MTGFLTEKPVLLSGNDFCFRSGGGKFVRTGCLTSFLSLSDIKSRQNSVESGWFSLCNGSTSTVRICCVLSLSLLYGRNCRDCRKQPDKRRDCQQLPKYNHNMMKLKITTLVLMSLCLIPAGAQEQHTADTTVTNHRTAAFDLPWLAKCYGLDWGYYDRISPVQDNTDCCAGPHSRPTSASSGASARHGVSW